MVKKVKDLSRTEMSMICERKQCERCPLGTSIVGPLHYFCIRDLASRVGVNQLYNVLDSEVEVPNVKK